MKKLLVVGFFAALLLVPSRVMAQKMGSFDCSAAQVKLGMVVRRLHVRPVSGGGDMFDCQGKGYRGEDVATKALEALDRLDKLEAEKLEKERAPK